MPDGRKHILVEQQTHREFEKEKKKYNQTQGSFIHLLIDFKNTIKKSKPKLYEKVLSKIT